jgi:hypothetical protein
MFVVGVSNVSANFIPTQGSVAENCKEEKIVLQLMSIAQMINFSQMKRNICRFNISKPIIILQIASRTWYTVKYLLVRKIGEPLYIIL